MELQGADKDATNGSSIADWGWRSSSFNISGYEDGSDGTVQSCSISDGSELFQDVLGMEDFCDQEDNTSPSDILAQSFVSAFGNIPNARKERSKKLKSAKLQIVSEEDYDDPVKQKLVLLLKERARAILETDARAPEYLKWFYVPTFESSIDFSATVSFLGGTPDAVRLKLSSYLFRHWVILSEPISDFVYPPEDLISKATYYAGHAAQEALRIIWSWPGVTQSYYVKAMKKKAYSEALAVATLEHLLESKLILDQSDNLYVLGHYGKLVDKSNPWK